jgi:hypothetical protein
VSHYCRICARTLSNESFSGKGHRRHVCRACSQLTKLEREAIEAEDEIGGFLRQSRISPKNIERLKALAMLPSPRISECAKLLQAVAAVTPFKRKRLGILQKEHPEPLATPMMSGLNLPDYFVEQLEVDGEDGWESSAETVLKMGACVKEVAHSSLFIVIPWWGDLAIAVPRSVAGG